MRRIFLPRKTQNTQTNRRENQPLSPLTDAPHPGPIASQARHETGAPNETIASRFVVPRAEREKSERTIGAGHRAEATVLMKMKRD